MTPAPSDRGLVHLGLLHDGPDDLAATVAPELRAALDAGLAVSTLVDRRTARALRELLGDDTAVDFRPPSQLLGSDPQRLVTDLRRARDGNRDGPRERAVVLVGHGGHGGTAAADDVAALEQALALLLAELPVTVICACPRAGDPGVAAAVAAGHPQLLAEGTRRDNPGHVPPPDHCPTPASLWGRRALRLSIRTTHDLRLVRERVSELAGGLGLDTDETAEAVLAVHEAALVAAGGGPALDAGGGESPCLVEVRTAGRTMLAEVSGPDRPDPPDPTEPTLGVFRRAAGSAAVHDVDGARPLRVVAGRGVDAPVSGD